LTWETFSKRAAIKEPNWLVKAALAAEAAEFSVAADSVTAGLLGPVGLNWLESGSLTVGEVDRSGATRKPLATLVFAEPWAL
jgi:hypothetical protein